jgi:hypothetical protein
MDSHTALRQAGAIVDELHHRLQTFRYGVYPHQRTRAERTLERARRRYARRFVAHFGPVRV